MDKGLFKRKGKILIAVNEWLTFYNVRVNQLNLITGREMLLKIKPTQHTASQSVKSLPIESRKCRLTTENHVNNNILKHLNFFNTRHFRYQTVCSLSTNRKGVCLNARSGMSLKSLDVLHGIFQFLLSYQTRPSAMETNS